MALGKCSNDHCEEEIIPEDVEQARVIEKSPQFVALRYKCVECGLRSNLVASVEDWEHAKRAAREADRKARTVDMRPHRLELDAVEGADDLVALWSAQKSPPILEDRIEEMKNCCDDCRKRLYG